MTKKITILSVIILGLIIAIFVGLNRTDSKLVNTKKEYSRVISLLPSATQSIYYLKAQDRLKGRSNYCMVDDSNRVEIVGSVTNPNLEKIISLKPDVVILSSLVSPKDVETLQKFGIRVETMISPKNFNEICEQFLEVGKLVGKESEAQKTIIESQQKVQTMQQNRTAKPSIFMQVGADPIYSVIPNTFMEDYIQLSGGENIAKDLTKGIVGREFVISKNPDYIFVVTMGIIGDDEVEKWNKFTQISAVKNKHIYVIDSEIACQPTPFSFIQTLEQINNIIKDE